MIIVDGNAVDYQESGEGPAILFVPGSYSTTMAWKGMQNLLPPRFRLITTSLLGYGNSEETRSLEDLDMAHEVRAIEAVADKVGAPVHLVGHSFGGTIALAAAVAGNIEVASITTFEANPIDILRQNGDQRLFEEIQKMGTDFEAAYDRGERDAAGLIIDFWGGENSFASMPEQVRDYCRATAFANVLDWRTVFTFKAAAADYAKLTMPVLLVRGGIANPLLIRVTDILQQYLPDCRTAVVEGANHFLNTSHPHECAQLLTTFLQEIRQ